MSIDSVGCPYVGQPTYVFSLCKQCCQSHDNLRLVFVNESLNALMLD